MKILTLLAAATLAATPLLAQDKTPGRELAELAFKSISTNDRDYIDMGEFSEFSESVFAGMDYDDNAQITLSEFLSWDFGMKGVAQEAGRLEAYNTALRVVFAFWDRDGDQNLSQTEQRQNLNFDFQRADTDNDAVLTQEEFLTGYTVMVALRAAINPAPVE